MRWWGALVTTTTLGALAACAAAKETIFVPNPRTIAASFVKDATDTADFWTRIAVTGTTICARDEKAVVTCARLSGAHRFVVTPLVVPRMAVTAFGVWTRGFWATGEDGTVVHFPLDPGFHGVSAGAALITAQDGSIARVGLDQIEKPELVEWLRGAIDIDAADYEVGPGAGYIVVGENVQLRSAVCGRMPNEVRCAFPTASFMPPREVRIPLVTGAIAVGRGFACAITSPAGARTVSCWGANSHGELGDGTRRSTYDPVLVRNVDAVVQLDAARDAACAVREDGLVACWGRVGWDTAEHDTPRLVPNLADVAEVALGYEHLCARTRSGGVTCIGNNERSQLGSTIPTDDVGRSTIEGLDDVVQLVAVDSLTCALRANHSIVCWGERAPPQTITFRTAPGVVSDAAGN
jgi:hypothetical protein